MASPQTITIQGHPALAVKGAITDGTRLFHLCASAMVHTTGRLGVRSKKPIKQLKCLDLREETES